MAEDKTPAKPSSDEEGDNSQKRFRRLTSKKSEGADQDREPKEQGDENGNSLDDTQPSRPNRILDDGETGELIAADEAQTIPPSKDEFGFTPAPPALGETPVSAAPKMDASGMPLPQRVPERDVDATQVVGSAFFTASTTQESQTETKAGKGNSPDGGSRFKRMGCLMRGAILTAFASIVLVILGVSFALYQYSVIAATLPSVDDLRERASQFETTRILDSGGNLLYEILDPSAGRRTNVPLENISPNILAATIATEDKEFYKNPGFSPLAIFRAFYQNISSGEVVSGASTITQQLARILLLSPEEASEISYMRKVREAILAAEITRRYSKDDILELYLNEIYYGNLAYGVQAAAETYFGIASRDLNLAQASFLAGLPQAPSVYDVYTNREATFVRQQNVLRAMHLLSTEQNCIYVSNQSEDLCVDLEQAAEAALIMLDYEFKVPDVAIRYPHWVHYIRSLLEEQYDPQTIYRSGFTVYTTLDARLQDLAQEKVREQVEALADRNAGSGALIAIRPKDGAILAMVGSADFYNEEIDGQVNMTISPRQPGSSIKALTYALAFEKGWTPGTLLWDVPSEFPPSGDPNDPREPYIPENYDNRFHGPVTVRDALANSYNIPAVKTLDFVGIYDDADTGEIEGLVAFAHRMGISDLNEPDYGLSLTLGGGEVKLLDLTNAYAIFANEGQRVRPYAIAQIVDHAGEIVFTAAKERAEQIIRAEQVIRAEHAFLISSILSDQQARIPSFGSNSILNLVFPAAAKTGTTNDFRDSWTLGYTADLAVGVWVGNADFTPMDEVSGGRGAAPIWAKYMQEAIEILVNGNPAPFVKPEGVEEKVVCSISGALPSEWCPGERREYFASDQPPRAKEDDLWQEILIDMWTGKRASSECSDYTEEEFAMNVQDSWAIEWLSEDSQGKKWASDHGFEEPIFFTPAKACKENDAQPLMKLVEPRKNQVLTSSPLEIILQADATKNFKEFTLEFAYGHDPDEWDWEELESSRRPVPEAESIYSWNLKGLRKGILSLRLIMYSTKDTFVEKTILLNVKLPTPTARPSTTPSFTVTASQTNTPSFTVTASQTNAITATEAASATATPLPSNTALASATESATASQTESASNTATNTGTAAPSETASATETATETVTESLTPSETPTPSPTDTL